MEWEKLLLKHAQLALACQKLQNKTAHPGEPQATETQDGPPDNSQAIALMRKTFFADVDEYERSHPLKIPPLPDPYSNELSNRNAGFSRQQPPVPNPCSNELSR
jgi:hypothetical protein